MKPSDYVKQLTDNGITSTSDGLLRDFISRGNYMGAIGAIDSAMVKRFNERQFLFQLLLDLKAEVKA